MPSFLKEYFWDVDFSKLDKKKHSQFIIERILEYGNRKAVAWLKKNFELPKIKKILCDSKNLSAKSANFWHIIFGLKKNKISCLKKLSQKKHKLIWRY